MTKWSCVGCWLSGQTVPAISSHKHWSLCLWPYRAPAITEPFLCSPPSAGLCVQGSFLQLLFVPGCLLCLQQSVFVWERGGGAPVCVGFINLEHSSKEMLSKLGGVNVNPSLPSFTDSASLRRGFLWQMLWEGYEVAVSGRESAPPLVLTALW